jgi:hypothetical protein
MEHRLSVLNYSNVVASSYHISVITDDRNLARKKWGNMIQNYAYTDFEKDVKLISIISRPTDNTGTDGLKTNRA